MRKFRDYEGYNDDLPTKRKEEDRRKHKRIQVALKTKNIRDLIDYDDEES